MRRGEREREEGERGREGEGGGEKEVRERSIRKEREIALRD